MEFTLNKDKVTPGAVRFKEDKADHPSTYYLTKEQFAELGSPDAIKITVEAA